MKWRHSLIYLAVFLGLGGFYFFQKTKMEEKEAAEQAAQKVFAFRLADLQSLEILPRGEEGVYLSRNGAWKIIRPIQAETDGFAVENYGITLMELTRERDMDTEASKEALKRYGLDPPKLQVRFQAGGQWGELLLGDKNPFGDGFYAAAGHVPGVFLISSGVGDGLFKSAGDLRERQLLSFSPEEVQKLLIRWHDGTSVVVEKVEREGDRLWAAPAFPETNIDKIKVDHLLQQLQWLRARNFLEEEPVRMEAHGLAPPWVNVVMEAHGRETPLELRIGKPADGHGTLTAFSPRLGAVVEIDSTIWDEIPQDVSALENRSILTADTGNLTRVHWLLQGKKGQVVRQGRDRWAVVKEDGEHVPLTDSWLVQSLLWNMGDMEYLEEWELMGDDVVPESMGDGGTHSIELWGENELLVKISWVFLEGRKEGIQAIRWTRAGKSREVLVSLELLNRVTSALQALDRSV